MAPPERRRPTTQDLVRAAMSRVGGYWRPLAAAARLLEELGEVAEQLADPQVRGEDLVGELADLWIITAAMADQFNGRVAEPDAYPRRAAPEGDRFAALVAAGGRVARIVNFYDGPKNPRSLEGWITLEQAVRTFHGALADLAYDLGVSLRTAVDAKLAAIPAVDHDRFARSHDGRTAPVLARFEAVRESTLCPYAATARLWGAPDWADSSFDANLDRIAPTVVSFTKATAFEELDALIVPGPSFDTFEDLAAWFREFLVELSRRDPRQEGVIDGSILRVGWQFAFNGRRMFVAVFSPLYAADHPRHAPGETFVFLQPEDSFGRKGVGSDHPQSRRRKDEIRQRFAMAGRAYPVDAKDARVEPPLYLLPRWEGDEAARWWDSPA